MKFSQLRSTRMISHELSTLTTSETVERFTLTPDRASKHQIAPFPLKPEEIDTMPAASHQEERKDDNSSSSDKSGRKTWLMLVKEYCIDESTLHGVGFVADSSRFYVRRILWLLIVTVAVAGFGYSLTNSTIKYLRYEKNVNVELNYEKKVPFPAVTICNQNQIRLTAAVKGGYYSDAVRLISASMQTSRGSVQDYIENKVTSIECEPEYFNCDSKCLPNARKCDGFSDCVDGGDEYNCESCLRIEVAAVESNETFLSDDHILGTYRKKKNESDPEKIYYEREMWDKKYLLQDPQGWLFVKLNSSYRLMPKSGSTVASPNIAGNWEIEHPEGGIIDINITCKGLEADRQNITSLVTRALNQSTVIDMYEDGAHQKSELIEGCFFKGSTCSSDFAVEYTDHGRCYTFKTEETIEKAGPGFGLSVLLNIQQYDYIRRPEEGIGVQVLIYDYNDKPIMTQKSFAVSPGMNTFVSVERTELTNLPPPHAACTEENLEYYDNYTVPTCTLNCMNKLSREKCSCRDVFMPQDKDDFPVCSLDDYTDCWIPTLQKLHKELPCRCGTPCKEVVLVPSLSFSGIFTDADLLSGDDLEKRTRLQNSLKEAREISYRIRSEKFLETTRFFRTTKLQFLDSSHEINGALSKLKEEAKIEEEMIYWINKDCLWFTKNSHDVIVKLSSDIMNAALVLYYTIGREIESPMKKLRDKLDRIKTCYDSGKCLAAKSDLIKLLRAQDTGLVEDLVTEIYEETMDGLMYVKKKNELFRVNYRQTLMQQDFDYALSENYTSVFEGDLRAGCPWCATTPRNPLLTIIETKLNKSMVDIANRLNETDISMRKIYSALVRNNPQWNTSNAEVLNIEEQVESIMSTLENKTIAVVEQAATFLTDLLRIITPECDTNLQAVHSDYTDLLSIMKTNMEDVAIMLNKYDEITEDLDGGYRELKYNLTDVHETLLSKVSTEYLKTKRDDLEYEFSTAAAVRRRLRHQVETIYRMMKAQVPDNTTKQNLLSSGNFSTWAKLTRRWENVTEAINKVLRQTNSFNEYLRGFVAGNVISNEFYAKNFLKLDVFYKELTERKVKQQEAYPFIAFLGEIGGNSGLLIGASAMTVIELADFFISNALHRWRESRRKRK